MRKAKVITALALTVVMLVAMIGLASALDTLVTGPVYESDGTIVPYADVKVYNDSDYNNLVGTGSTASNGWYTVPVPSEYLSEGDTAYVTASKGDKSGVNQSKVVDAGFPGFGAEIAVVVVTFSVPEFATIAIPVAAILGLLFFFNHRKRKRE